MNKTIELESWSAVSDEIGSLVERDRKRMSMAWRLWEICLARANNWGHAAFRPDELVRMACGGNSRSDRQAVGRGLRTLEAMERIMPLADNGGSTVLCVVVNRRIVERKAGKGSRKDVCSEPGHMDKKDMTWTPEGMMRPTFTEAPARAPEVEQWPENDSERARQAPEAGWQERLIGA